MLERAPFKNAITESGGRVTFHGMFNTNEGANREPITQPAQRAAAFKQANSEGDLRRVETLREVYELGQEAAEEASALLLGK